MFNATAVRQFIKECPIPGWILLVPVLRRKGEREEEIAEERTVFHSTTKSFFI